MPGRVAVGGLTGGVDSRVSNHAKTLELHFTYMNSLIVSGSKITLAEGTRLTVRTNKRGKELGVSMVFTGEKSASELKEEGEAAGLKGAALREYVDKSLRGDVAAAAWTRHGVAMEALRASGAVPTGMEGNKKGDTFKATYVVTSVSKEVEMDQVRLEERAKMEAALKAAGVDSAAIQAALASL